MPQESVRSRHPIFSAAALKASCISGVCVTYTRELDAAVAALGCGTALLQVQSAQLTTGGLNNPGLVRPGVVPAAKTVYQHFVPCPSEASSSSIHSDPNRVALRRIVSTQSDRDLLGWLQWKWLGSRSIIDIRVAATVSDTVVGRHLGGIDGVGWFDCLVQRICS